jgi:sec-independent protein translocase protein TatA
MGFGGISVWQLLIILAIVIMLFGTKRLRTLGSDLGSAVKGFRKSLHDDDNSSGPAAGDQTSNQPGEQPGEGEGPAKTDRQQ